MSEATTRKILGPINRVEGDLEVKLEVAQDRVTRAWVNSPLFRGFEAMLIDRAPGDALVYTPRICGICSVAQSFAAAGALAAWQNITPADNGRLAANLLLACENLADHLSHFYLFFMPDFARQAYTQKPWYDAVASRFRAQTGAVANDVLPARSALLQMTAILAGKWPHSLSIQPGGSSKVITRSEQLRLQAIISNFRSFLERCVFNDALENVSALASIEQLAQWRQDHAGSDFARFLTLAQDLQLHTIGRAGDRFLCYGGYQLPGEHLFRAGIVRVDGGHPRYRKLNADGIREDTSHAWLRRQAEPRHPFQGRTEPDAESSGYTWCKAPRLDGESYEVGALARQVVNGHSLALDMVAKWGSCVTGRVVARLLELAIVVPEMALWCQQLALGEAFCRHGESPADGRGVGMIEAARGSLGHWLSVADKRIANYQIIAPTTWNFSPRDASGHPGPLEQALEKIRVEKRVEDTVAIQHVIRSFDPCMVCTVH